MTGRRDDEETSPGADRPSKRARSDASQFESDIEEALKRSLRDQQQQPGAGCSHWQAAPAAAQQAPADPAPAAPSPPPDWEVRRLLLPSSPCTPGSVQEPAHPAPDPVGETPVLHRVSGLYGPHQVLSSSFWCPPSPGAPPCLAAGPATSSVGCVCRGLSLALRAGEWYVVQ